MERQALRVSDAERERTATALRDHCAAGRLSIDDLELRLASAYAAQTVGELAAVTEDLPAVPARPAPPRRGRRVFWPGMTPFQETRRLRAPRREAFEDALLTIAPRMAMHGFHLVEDRPPRRMVFARDAHARVTVLFLATDDGGTDVSAFGEAPRAIRKAFATLRD